MRDPRRHLAHLIRLGHSVIVDDAKKALVRVLQGHPVANGAQIVAEVQLARGLDPGENISMVWALFRRHTARGQEHPVPRRLGDGPAPRLLMRGSRIR